MAQVSVNQFYNTRKHQRNLVKDGDFEKPIIDDVKLEVPRNRRIAKAVKDKNTVILSDKSSNSKELPIESKSITTLKVGVKKASNRNKSTKVSKKTTVKKGNSQTTLTSFYSSADPSRIDETVKSSTKPSSLSVGLEKSDAVSNCTPVIDESKTNPNITQKNACPISQVSDNAYKLNDDFKDPVKEIKVAASVQSPKRKLPIPVELTPTKKKQYLDSPLISEMTRSPHSKTSAACRKLDMGLPIIPSKNASPFNSPVKNQLSSPRKVMSPKEAVNAVIDQSRAKLMLSPKLGELRKSLENFSRKTSIIKSSMIQSNPYKITSVVSPTKTKSNMPVLPPTPAYERYSHLADPQPSLILPKKYRLLGEMFRSIDTVVSMLHNRKELITFDKVQDGVQKMMKRNFLKSHFGQIVTVLPSAYNLTIEKCGVMNKKAEKKDYQLIITPILTSKEKAKKSKAVVFEPMTPLCLAGRVHEFHDALLKITMEHHAAFLERSKFPSVHIKELKHWNPKFPLDSVPDIQPSALPEPPENKVYTAKDVLNKVKGAINNKVAKALQSVADESEKNITLELKDVSNSKPDTNKALKGVCSDLLAKIRAREQAKLLETMTRTPEESKRQAMLQRLPKIVNILWHYFIAERKIAVPVDVVVEKIIHSFNSLATPDNVKDHLKLISETFPGWLTYVEVKKGVFVQIDKKRNINEMLDKFQH